MHTQTFAYEDRGAGLEGFYAYDKSVGSPDKKPLVLVAHDWTGCNAFAQEKAKKLATLGYLGFAIDMFGKGKLGHTKEEKSALIQPFISNRALLLQRIQAALAAAKNLPQANPQKIAAMGFCFGGLCVLDLARSGADLRGVISFHGLLNAPENQPKTTIRAKVLVLHGHDDPMVPSSQVLRFATEMTQAQADWQIHMYGNTMHAFTNPEAHDPAFGTVYAPLADYRSWETAKLFFTEIFTA